MRTKNKDVKNELVEELSKKLEQIKDPHRFYQQRRCIRLIYFKN